MSFIKTVVLSSLSAFRNLRLRYKVSEMKHTVLPLVAAILVRCKIVHKTHQVAGLPERPRAVILCVFHF